MIAPRTAVASVAAVAAVVVIDSTIPYSVFRTLSTTMYQRSIGVYKETLNDSRFWIQPERYSHVPYYIQVM